MYQYQLIAAALREDIVAGRLVPGSRIPARHMLCRRFGVSEITVRRAVNELEAQGWLEGARGHGRAPLVYRPEFQTPDGNNWPRRICLVSFWPFTGNSDSDLPGLLYSLVPTLHELNYGVELLPCQDVSDMLGLLKLRNARTRPDGLIVLPALTTETMRLIRGIRQYHQQYILLTSSEWTIPTALRQKNLPGIFVNEVSSLRKLLAAATAANINSILLVGNRNEALIRMQELLRIADADRFHIEIRDLASDVFPNPPAAMLAAIRRATENRRRLLLLEGDLQMLVMFECAMQFSRLVAGRDISMAFFQHYCDLDADYARRYTSVTRSYARIGEAAARLMIRVIRNPRQAEQQIIDADFHDAHTII